MLNHSETRRDPFTFSLGGMKAIASFAFAPAIASDRIRKERACGQHQGSNDQGRDCHSWQSHHGQPAQCTCA